MSQNVSTYRLAAIDWLRGLTIIAMVIDHCCMYFVEGWHFRETAFRHGPGGAAELPGMYVIRGLSHFGAPAFLLLAGFSLALSINKRHLHNVSEGRIDRDLLLRGLILVGVDLVVMAYWVLGMWMFDILSTIGLCMILMIPIRRVRSVPLLVGLSVFWMAVSEPLVLWLSDGGKGRVDLAAVLLTGGRLQIGEGLKLFNYPVLLWLPFMTLGFAFGRYWTSSLETRNPMRVLRLTAIAAFSVFVVLRGLNGFGNMNLPRDESMIGWLFLSKYPPSLTFGAFAVGCTAVLYGLFHRLEIRRSSGLLLDGLSTLGEVPLFFYLGHFIILWVLSSLLGVKGGDNVLYGLGGALLLAVFMTPLCWIYGTFREKVGVLRYF